MNARMPMHACAAVLVAATLSPLALPVQSAEQDRLIPRKDIFGNPTRTLPAISPDGKKFLLTRSPITKVDQIRRPLLIGQGANDPRVTRKASDQIVAAMNARKIPVTYAIYADEGHGFARPENRISFYAIAENFLSTCLAGRAEPIGDDAKGAALAVPDGAGNVPGLKDALAAVPKYLPEHPQPTPL